MEVYVVEKGCYSDRRVEAVVETEEEAKELCRFFGSRYDDVSYTKFDTKSFQTTKKFAFEVNLGSANEGPTAEYEGTGYYDWLKGENTYIGAFPDWIIFARDPEQAIKIAQDLEAERLAKERGLV